MGGWQLASSYPAGALIKSFVRPSTPQPHSLAESLLQSPAAKTSAKSPFQVFTYALTRIFVLQMMSYPRVSLRNGVHALIQRLMALAKKTLTHVAPLLQAPTRARGEYKTSRGEL
jgi:hypothetical protein